MNPSNDRPRGKLIEGSTSTTDEIAVLKAQVQDMQLEIEILKETIDVLKKDPGINETVLNNKEKAVIVDALKKKYSLPLLLKKLDFSKSSYYYQALRKSFSEREMYQNYNRFI
jgi:putative transposase